jgi:hypothetical protein
VKPPIPRAWWRDVATVVGILGLLITLAFNTLGVREQAKQARQTRTDTQIGLLTQLNDLVDASDRAINGTRAPTYRCKPWAHTLTRSERAAVLAATQYYDYLAWLFNQGHISMPSARAYWSRSMLDAYELAAAYNDPGWINQRFHELWTFRNGADERFRPKPCA